MLDHSTNEAVLVDGTDPDETIARAPRRACHLAAELSFGDARNRIICKITNMSATGAGVAAEDRHTFAARCQEIGSRPVALFLQNDRCVVECTVVWQDDARAGLRFRSAFRPAQPGDRF